MLQKIMINRSSPLYNRTDQSILQCINPKQATSMSQKPASKRFCYFVTAGLPLIICEVTDY